MNTCQFTVIYNNNKTEIKMESAYPIGICLQSLYERWGISHHRLYYDNTLIDYTLPAGLYQGKKLHLRKM